MVGMASVAWFHRLPLYFRSAGFFPDDFGVGVIGTMMWAYGAPFHITHGPPLVQYSQVKMQTSPED